MLALMVSLMASRACRLPVFFIGRGVVQRNDIDGGRLPRVPPHHRLTHRATVPRDIGHVFALRANVRLVDPPLKPPAFHLMRHWHAVVNADSANIWLRQMVKGLFND